MRDSRRVAPARPAAVSSAPAEDVSDGGLSAMRMLASAAHISGSRAVGGSRPGAAASPAGWGDRAGLAAMSSLHRPTVTGAAAGARHTSDHVGGAMAPPAANTVALSDGTRISFGAVAEAPEFADA
jgi:hypothetical protein